MTARMLLILNDTLTSETNCNCSHQLAVLPIQQCFGLIFAERFSALGITATQTSLILHLNGTIMCSLGLISGPMMKRFTFRQVAYFGSLTIVFGICATAFAVSMPALIITYCIIIGKWLEVEKERDAETRHSLSKDSSALFKRSCHWIL